MRGQAVAVVGAAGGVGATTLAALLAARLAAGGRPVALLDLDVRRGGVEVLLGTEAREGPRWADLATARGPLDGADLAAALPRWGRVEVLGADRRAVAPDAAAVAAVHEALLEAGRLVVLDVPGHALADDGVAGLVRAARVLVVTGQDVLGVAAAAAATDALGPGAALVLRRRRGGRVAPAQVGAALRLPVAGLLPHDRRVAGAVDRGLGPAVAPWSPLARAVARVARGLTGG
ncbi:MAG: P-loop NTPase [Actinomycetales bacterium]|nr:P-loop NTPase [Actinomycetales bacterium]